MRRVGSQHKGIKRQGAGELQLLTFWVSISACAAGHSCRVGLGGHWVRGQNKRLWRRTHTQTHTSSYNHSAYSKKQRFSCIRLTGKYKNHSEESQQDCICPGHLLLCLDCREMWLLLVKTRRERCMQGLRGGVGVFRNIDCLSEVRKGVTTLYKKLEPRNCRENFQVTWRCWEERYSALIISLFV